MNRQLEAAIKELNLSPKKTKLIIFNAQMVTPQDAGQALEILKRRGQQNAVALLVTGDVREAVEVWELPETKT